MKGLRESQNESSVDKWKYDRKGPISDVYPCIHMYVITVDVFRLDFEERGKVRSTKKVPRDTPVHKNPIQEIERIDYQKRPVDMMGQGLCMMCPHASSCL